MKTMRQIAKEAAALARHCFRNCCAKNKKAEEADIVRYENKLAAKGRMSRLPK